MRIPKSAFPESVWNEIARVMGTIHSQTGGPTPELGRAHQLAVKRYWESRGLTVAGWCAYPLAVIAAGVAVKSGLGVSPAFALVPGLFGTVPLHFAFPSTRGLTPRELTSYLPLMSLSPTEATYVEAVAEAYAPGADPSLRAEVVPAIRKFVEESARLDRLEAQLADGGSNSVQADVDAMRLRLESVEDESAREALRQGIAIAERRLSSAISEKTARERIDAHRAMIRQAALAARETVRRLRLSPESAGTSSDLDLSALRESADGAGREVAALEAAVQEMRAL